MDQLFIIGGGTVFHVRPHLALFAPAYGKVAHDIYRAVYNENYDGMMQLITTKPAGNVHKIWTSRSGYEDVEPVNLETNTDVAALLDRLVAEPTTKIIFLPAALCDFEVDQIATDDEVTLNRHAIGKEHRRLHSKSPVNLSLVQSEKIIGRVRKTRKDVFLVGFKTTSGATPQEQFDAGLELLKKSSCNLVLANDIKTHMNIIVTPEQAPYGVTTNRFGAVTLLVKMALARSAGHFTRSTVTEGRLVSWNGEIIPDSLRTVVNHCIKRGAYRTFLGKTVGHFAFNTGGGTFVTSRRGVNFNELEVVGMVSVMTEGNDSVTAIGAKPSVGGQSQRIIFERHPDVDCIVHFHCPLKKGFVDRSDGLDNFRTREQWPYECGSHECGKNTSDGLELFYIDKDDNMIKAVMLDKHGPNIVFSKNIDPNKVIEFIERYWDLERSTSEVPL